MQKKELHLGKNLTQLEQYFAIDAKMIRKKPVHQILMSLKKMVEKAEMSRLDGDEETSYVMYMKFMNMMTELQKMPDYKKEKTLILKLIGNNSVIHSHFDRIEKLKKSLKERYKVAFPMENLDTQDIENGAIAETTKKDVDTDMTMETTMEIAEVRELIDCTGLFNMMNDGKQLLIMDCRSEVDYDNSRINYKYTMNVPEHLPALGMTASKIHQQLPNESKVWWELRKSRPYLIFIDWTSKRFNRNSPVWHLKEILLEWDQDTDKKPEILLLQGGYEQWKTLYPMKCINPQYSRPQTSNGDVPTIEDVEYPNIDDIQMKDASLNRTTVPQIDRSMKVNAVKAFENKSQLELLEENEQIMDKSLKNEKEMLELETDLKLIVSNKENTEDSTQKEQQYMFKIWELQSKQNDYNREEKAIKEQLDQNKKISKGPQQTQELTKVMELEIHLRELKDNVKIVQEQREKEKRDREEALKFARDRKPTFNDHKTPLKSQRKDELILSPKTLTNQVVAPSIPSFDRSSKPLQTVTRQIFDDREFSPVYGRVERGLTGLKNLGNSCYMNSIIQCLSNTSTLTDYLLDSKFEKSVNINNKTQGHIVRSLAAVIRMLWNGECKYISSKHLKAAIGELDHLFYGMDQQDSHEFLIMLIDWLQSDLQTIPVQPHTDLPASEKAWLEYTKAKESFILRLFYGQIKSTVKCTECSKESSTYETFSNLSLELPQKNIDSCHITNCFDMYFHGERVKGWNCPHCKVPRDAIKKLDISKLPPVLVIHLKRFYADPYMNSTFRKKTTYVEFPLQDMSMISYVARSEKTNGSNAKHVYNLYAVSNHYGSMESGHYTAFCKNYMQKKWYKFDDHTVSPVDRSDVKSSAAYILFYTTNTC